MLSLRDNGKNVWDWLAQNKQWIFSGVGVTALAVIWWLGRKLLGGSKNNTSGSNSQVNIHFSPNISQTNTQTFVSERKSTGAESQPDIRFIRHSSEFNPKIGTGKNCVLLAFRNEGNADATHVIANISYTRSPGHAMVVDYGAWVEHEPIINLPRGRTKRLILAVSEDGKRFAVTNDAPSTRDSDLRIQFVGEIVPADWLVIVTLNADNFRRDYTFNLNVAENGNFLLYPDRATRPPQDQAPKKIDTTPQPNVRSLRPEITVVVYNEASDVWSRGAGEVAIRAALLPFSNDARPFQKTASVRGIRARLTFYQKDKVEEFKRIDSGCWAGEAYLYADLGVGDIIYLIAAIQVNTHAATILNPRRSVNRYSEDHTVVDNLPLGNYELKVELTAGEHGEYADSYWYEVEASEELTVERIRQRPASMG